MVIMSESSNSQSMKLRNLLGNVYIFVLATILLVFMVSNIIAGVLAAPTVVILSDKSRTGRLNLENPSNKPKEIEVYFSFGLPETDSLGNIELTLQDSNVTDPKSALGWIRAFPRKLVLPANGSQVVRLVAHPPKDLPDGEYWARIIIRSQEGETSIPASTDNEQITTQLNMIMQTAISLKYRTGELAAKIDLANFNAQYKDGGVEVFADLVNQGNVSYLGVVTCRLLDADNRLISSTDGNLAVYRNLRKRMNLGIPEGDFKQPYQIELKISCEGRTDIARNDIVFGNEINYSAIVD
jgi:P pilus assembly chaperone PapD